MCWQASFSFRSSAFRCLADVPLRLQTTPPIMGTICVGLCWSEVVGVLSLLLARSFFERGVYGISMLVKRPRSSGTQM
jgi:hypothetical protein